MEVSRVFAFPIKVMRHTPRALIGPGAYEMVGVEARQLGIRRALLVTTGLHGTGLVEDVRAKLAQAGVEVVSCARVESNPKDVDVRAAHQVFASERCDAVVSLGGGSAHDAAKGVRLVAAHGDRDINEFAGFNRGEGRPNAAHIAVNTTAGTGSETSVGFVVTDTTSAAAPHKWIGIDETCPPTLAINDPVLLTTLPPDLTAFTGMDALAHAAEAYVSRLEMPASQGLALKAIELIARWLREAVANPRSYAAREGMLWAAYTAGLAFTHAGVGLVHAIANEMGGFYDLHHGLGNAIALPRAWAYNVAGVPERYTDLARALGEDVRGLSPSQAADRAVAAAARLTRDIGIPENYVGVGPYTKSRLGQGRYAEWAGPYIRGDEADVERVARAAQSNPGMANNPREVSLEQMRTVVRACLTGSLS